MEKNIVSEFEKNVKSSLQKIAPELFGKEKIILGVAVSGGADSIALLTALSHLAKEMSVLEIAVITVNHRIRSEEETSGDANFVKDYCKQLAIAGFPVKCTIAELERGQVENVAKKRFKGIEEAARFLRYEAFENFFETEKCDFLCLAHNQNDQAETILMRFLQGSGASALSGIKERRGKFLRPLLETSRKKIEEYLECQNILWRTDSTNFDTAYFRNRIRNNLIPCLNENFPGWQKGVFSGAEKNSEDNEVLEDLASKIEWTKNSDSCFSLDFKLFSNQMLAIKRRILFNAFNLCGVEKRIPQKIIKEISSWTEANHLEFCGIEVAVVEKRIFVKKRQNMATESGFFAIIEKSGSYHFSFGTLIVEEYSGLEKNRKQGAKITFCFDSERVFELSEIMLPFCFRSRQLEDCVETSTGSNKSVSDILSSWHVPVEEKNRIPIVEECTKNGMKIKCIWGSVFGFDNWIVK